MSDGRSRAKTAPYLGVQLRPSTGLSVDCRTIRGYRGREGPFYGR